MMNVEQPPFSVSPVPAMILKVKKKATGNKYKNAAWV